MILQTELDTLVVLKSFTEPQRLRVCRLEEITVNREMWTETIPTREDATATTVDVGPYGVAYADDTGRIYLSDVTPTRLDTKTDACLVIGNRETLWVGSVVTALARPEAQRLVCGDAAGRLMLFIPDGLDKAYTPELIATADKPWLVLLPAGKGEWIAVATDGAWARLDRHGVLIGESSLPVNRGVLIEAHFCVDHQLLIYRVVPECNNGGNGMRGDDGWQAWSFADRSPVSLPDVLRFAPVLTTTHRAVMAFNAQGGSWMGVPSDESMAVRQLTGWPVGHSTRVVPVDDRPVIVRLDRCGALQALGLEDDTWRMLNLPVPTMPVANFWAADSVAWSRAISERQQREVAELSEQTLAAHQVHRWPERDALLQRLEQTVGGLVHAALLRSRFAAEDGRWLDAVEELCRSVFRRAGLLHPHVQQRLGKALWHIGDLPGLSTFSPDIWHDIYNAPPEAVSQLHNDTSTPFLIDIYASDPSGGCQWSEFAWSALKRWGSPSPCWLGGEREPPLALHGGDLDLLPQVMKVCGASHVVIRVLPPNGDLQDHEGWVISEPIGDGMHRQLVAWIECLHAGDHRLALRWAVRAERFASPSSWIAAWDAVHDHAWRDEHQHRIEVIHQALAHRVVPDAPFLEHDGQRGALSAAEGVAQEVAP